MKKQNIILDYKNLLNSYKNKNISLKSRSFLPIYLDAELAAECTYLIGKVMGDGNLDKVFTTRFIGKEKDLIILRNLISNKFKIDIDRLTIRKRKIKGISYLLQVNNAFFGRILFLLGAPIGNKTKTKFNMPLWISKRKILRKRFLQALLEDELTTIKIEKCNYSVKPRLNLTKKLHLIKNLREFMQEVKEAIESFGVGCNHISKPINRKGTDSWELYFHINRNKKNIIKFKEEIGFRFNLDKVKRLDTCYKIIKNSL